MVWLVLIMAGGFGLATVLGAPYLPLLRRRQEEILDLAGLKPGETLLDLGSGDGAVLRAAARRGARAVGYEINPWLFLYSKIACWPWRDQIEIRFGNYWLAGWPKCEVVYVFLIEHYMAKLDQQLGRRLISPTRVVSYVYKLPSRKPHAQLPDAYLYLFG